MKVNTYLNFPGTCAEALDFYVKNLGAEILMKSTFAQMSSSGAPQNPAPGPQARWHNPCSHQTWRYAGHGQRRPFRPRSADAQRLHLPQREQQ